MLGRLGRQGLHTQLLRAVERAQHASAMDRRHYNAAIRGLVGLGAPHAESLRLLQRMRADGFTPDRTSYTAALCVLASGGRWAEAARLLTAMAADGYAPEAAAYNLAIDAHARCGRSTDALRLLREMESQGEMESPQSSPGPLAYSMVISASGGRGELARTCELWEELRAVHGEDSEEALVARLAAPLPAEQRCRVLSACGASVAALERLGQWDGALRRFTLLRAFRLAGSSSGFNGAIRALGRATPSWLRPLRLELYSEMEELGLDPDAHAHAAARHELQRGGPLAAERTARVRVREARDEARAEARAARAATATGVGSDHACDHGGLAWPPLRYGKLGRGQSGRQGEGRVPLTLPLTRT